MKHILEADGIELSFGTRKILSDIYIKVSTGEITGLLARNGQGKSCLMNIIYGSLKAQSKSVRFDNQPIFEAFKRPTILNYLPQFNFIPKNLSLNNVFKDFELSIDEFVDFLPEFGERKNSKIKNLSGGERRLIEVYLIIKSKSKFSMLDEPFSHLMPLHLEKIKNLLSLEKRNKGILITDHLYKNVLDISHNLYLLKNGKTFSINNEEQLKQLAYL